VRRWIRKIHWRRVLLVLFGLWFALSLVLAVVVHTYGYVDHVQRADVIVVLGAGMNRNNTPSPAHRVRTNRAGELWEAGYAPVIICTGGTPGWATRSEADACRELLMERGIPESAIILEDRSRSTEENALYTHEIMDAHGWKTAVLVSDRYHLFRANWLFTQLGITVYTSPSSSGYLNVPQYGWVLLREVVALEWQAVKDVFNLPFTYVPVF
jgi:uncharacterized SAM-binding protein YcdF (DUF218 family)